MYIIICNIFFFLILLQSIANDNKMSLNNKIKLTKSISTQKKTNELQSLIAVYNARIDIIKYNSNRNFIDAYHQIAYLKKELLKSYDDCDQLLNSIIQLERIKESLTQKNQLLDCSLKISNTKVYELENRLDEALQLNTILRNQLHDTQQAFTKKKRNLRLEMPSTDFHPDLVRFCP